MTRSNATPRTVMLNGRFSFVAAPGRYTLRATRHGYTTFTGTMQVFELADKDVTIELTPPIPRGEARIVLTWGSTPADLDAYVTTPRVTSSGSACVVSWSQMRFHDGGISLDVYAIEAHGPETVTIRRFRPGTYTYTVRNASRGGGLLASQAMVRYYTSSGVRTFRIGRQGAVRGGEWRVLTINGRT